MSDQVKSEIPDVCKTCRRLDECRGSVSDSCSKIPPVVTGQGSFTQAWPTIDAAQAQIDLEKSRSSVCEIKNSNRKEIEVDQGGREGISIAVNTAVGAIVCDELRIGLGFANVRNAEIYTTGGRIYCKEISIPLECIESIEV